MKQSFLIVIALCVWTLPTSAQVQHSADFQYDGIFYSINTDRETVSVDWNGTITFVGIGHGCYAGRNVIVPSTVTYGNKTYTVTAVANNAFYFERVRSVTLPSTINSIGAEAFRGVMFAELKLPSSLRYIGTSAFAESEIQEIEIPSGVEELPNWAFRGARLSKITIPNTVKRIGKECFYQSQITSCIVPYGVERIEDGVFGETPLAEVTLPSTVNYIGNYAFKNTKLQNVMLPVDINSIGSEAFRQSPLQQITLPTSLSYLGESAFRDCTNLTYVSMSCPGLKEIGQYTFYNCTALEQMSVLPDAVRTIGQYAFYQCTSLDVLGISSSSQLDSIGDYAFSKSNIYSFNVPATTEYIGVHSFQDCKKLETVTFSSNSQLKYIESYAFSSCTALKKALLPNSTSHIGESAFRGCTSLAEVSFPQNVDTIKPYTFWNCEALKTITFCTPSKLKVVQEGSFSGCRLLEALAFPEGLEAIGTVGTSDNNGIYGGNNLSYVYIPSTVKHIGKNEFQRSTNGITFDLVSPIDSVGDYSFACAERINIRHYDSFMKFVTKSRPFDGGQGTGGYYYGTFPHIYHQDTLVTHYVVPDDVTVLRASTFLYNKDIRSVVLPKNLRTIENAAFGGCDSLQSVIFGDAIETIGDLAFSHCNIKEAHITNADGWIRCVNSSSKFDWSWFPNVLLNGKPFTEVVIPEGIIDVRKSAFENNKQMVSVYIPNSVTSIGDYAFRDCDSLHTVSFGNSLKTIGMYAFQRCKTLQTVTFTSTPESFGSGAFTQCSINRTNIVDPENWIRFVLSLKATNNYYNDPFNWGWFPNIYCQGQLVTNYVIPEEYTSIRDYAFLNNTNIQSVTFPNELTTIGSHAFEGCINLKTVNFGDSIRTFGDYAFTGCSVNATYITNYDRWMQLMFSGKFNVGWFPNVYYKGQLVTDCLIPEGTKTIPATFFSNNASIKNVVCPKSLESIGKRAFENSNLQSIIFNDSLKTIGQDAFNNCKSLQTITFGNSTVSVGKTAFYGCSALKKVNFGKSLLTFGGNAFRGCSVEEAHYDDYTTLVAMTTSPEYNFSWYWFPNAYYKGKLVTDFVVPEGQTAIRRYAFDGNPTVTSVTLPNSVKEIGDHAFVNCKTLKKVVFGDSIQVIRDAAFYGCSIDTVDIWNLTNWCNVEFENQNESNPLSCMSKSSSLIVKGNEINTLNIPTGVERINSGTFRGFARLESVTIPSSVRAIGDYAFAYCSDLTTIKYRKNPKLKSIGKYAFTETPLLNVEIPDSLKTISEGAFCLCGGLTNVTIPGTIVDIGDYAFHGCANLSNIVISEGVKSIGRSAFEKCSFSSIELPATLTSVGRLAIATGQLADIHIKDMASWCKIKFSDQPFFRRQYNYQGYHYYLNGQKIEGDFVVPEGVDSIGDYAFYCNCDFSSIVIPEGVKYIGTRAFCGNSRIMSISLPSTIESIGNFAFGRENGNERYPENAVISLKLKDIGSFVNANQNDGVNYTYCYSTYRIELYHDDEKVGNMLIPEGVTSIGVNAFRAFNITSVVLPSTLQSIGNEAFRWCYLITNVYSRSKFAPEGPNGVMTGDGWNDTGALQAIYVPKGRADSYKAKWSNSAGFVVEAPETVSVSGKITSQSLNKDITSHNFVYDDAVPYLDMTQTVLDETVTQEMLTQIADQGTIIFLPEDTEGIEGNNIVANGRTPKLILRDSTDFKAPYDFTADELVYQRSFKASSVEATTLCLPYSLEELPKGMKAYAFTGMDNDGKAVFTEVDAVEANMPYVVTATMNVDDLSAKNVQVKATPAEMPNGGNEACVFRGTLSTISHSDAADQEMYAMDSGKQWLSVYDANEAVSIPAGRAYLMPVEGAVTTSIDMVLKIISPIECAKGDANGDGTVDIADAVAVVNNVVGKANTLFVEKAADVDGDGVVDVADAVRIVNLVVGKIDALARQFNFSTPDPQ